MNRNKMSNCTNIYHNHTVNIIACVPCNNNNNNCTRIYNLQAQFCIYSCTITNQDNASTIDTFNTTIDRLIPSSTTTTTVQYNLSSLGTTTTTTIETSFPSTEAATTTVSLFVYVCSLCLVMMLIVILFSKLLYICIYCMRYNI